jgi:hypothetical protein
MTKTQQENHSNQKNHSSDIFEINKYKFQEKEAENCLVSGHHFFRKTPFFGVFILA